QDGAEGRIVHNAVGEAVTAPVAREAQARQADGMTEHVPAKPKAMSIEAPQLRQYARAKPQARVLQRKYFAKSSATCRDSGRTGITRRVG
ncbi:MAG TPA: hypothetical protein PKL24_24695, partial [Polyangiaceae bacterium]|nr:hypothetical protein [Polyangiaceae bacterium]HOD24265.1 hypothetical protein [Polyangiaceae bacterium]HOE50787.1 hypothetical protein [Polyangiaceae bacterium]HOH03465.1 hypothetical protein [Polyangiaceae bacterium]HOR37905.1 hypothetical protein [Polyangiaceae bacterium]